MTWIKELGNVFKAFCPRGKIQAEYYNVTGWRKKHTNVFFTRQYPLLTVFLRAEDLKTVTKTKKITPQQTHFEITIISCHHPPTQLLTSHWSFLVH